MVNLFYFTVHLVSIPLSPPKIFPFYGNLVFYTVLNSATKPKSHSNYIFYSENTICGIMSALHRPYPKQGAAENTE